MDQILTLLVLAFWAYLWIRIVGKTGNNQWLGLLMIIPIVNLIFMIWLAFSEWPVHRRSGTPSPGAPDQERRILS